MNQSDYYQHILFSNAAANPRRLIYRPSLSPVKFGAVTKYTLKGRKRFHLLHTFQRPLNTPLLYV